MDKEIALGSVGSLDLNFTGGVAKISIGVNVPGNVGVSGGAFVQLTSAAFISAVFAAIEAKLPAEAPIAESVKAALISAISVI